jgi:hypothetical protein
MTNFFGAITALLMCPMNSAGVGAFVRDAELTSSKCFMSTFRTIRCWIKSHGSRNVRTGS